MTFRPSHYQQAIFDFVQSGTGDGVVRATAGSGKTTTLVEIAKQLPDDLNAVFLAFNSHTAQELRERLPRHVKAFTVHQLGRKSLMTRFPKLAQKEVHKQKSRQIIRQHIQQMKEEFALQKEVWPQAEKYLYELLHFSMTNLTNTKLEEEVAALALEYNLFAPQDRVLEVQCHRDVRHLLRGRLDALKNHCIYDYEDMLYVPVILNLDIPKYDFVFVDEAQDLSALQLEVVLRAVSEGGRRLFVGDERQAIYGFTGADSEQKGRYAFYILFDNDANSESNSESL